MLVKGQERNHILGCQYLVTLLQMYHLIVNFNSICCRVKRILKAAYNDLTKVHENTYMYIFQQIKFKTATFSQITCLKGWIARRNHPRILNSFYVINQSSGFNFDWFLKQQKIRFEKYWKVQKLGTKNYKNGDIAGRGIFKDFWP